MNRYWLGGLCAMCGTVVISALVYRSMTDSGTGGAMVDAHGSAIAASDSSQETEDTRLVDFGPTGKAKTKRGTEEALDGMPGASRNTVFRVAIQDSGFECAEIDSVAKVEATSPLWRVSCTGAVVYTVGVGDLEELLIEPTPWDDPPRIRTYIFRKDSQRIIIDERLE